MAPVKKSSASATPAPAAVAATPVVETKKVKAVKAEPVAAPAPVVVAEQVAAVEEVVSSSSLEDFVSKFNALSALLKETQSALKVLSKEYERMKKTVTKSERKRANARTNPNGFAKPALITDALCEFLAVPKGTQLSRTDVTRKINAYIKEHNLNKPENKRIILPDEKLRKILGVKPTEEVSFFSLQRYLSPLFVKKVTV
jgi:chromatin remodeling complex protein RSC6